MLDRNYTGLEGGMQDKRRRVRRVAGQELYRNMGMHDRRYARQEVAQVRRVAGQD